MAYEYNGDGARISKTQGGTKTKYINDRVFGLTQVLMETNSAGNILATCTYGDNLISMNRADANSYYHYDGLGSARQLTNSTGTVVASYTYDAFGNVIASSGSITNPYGFTGQQQFAEADSTVFLRARYYKPSTGRFTSRDPIGYKDGLNIYTYVKNNPINFTDLLGLGECPPTEAEAASSSSFCGGFWANFPFHWGVKCYREVVPIGSGPSGLHCCYSGGKLHDWHTDPHEPAVGRSSDGSCEYDDFGRIGDHCGDIIWPVPTPTPFPIHIF